MEALFQAAFCTFNKIADNASTTVLNVVVSREEEEIVIISTEQITTLKLYISDIETIIATDNVQLVLDAIDDIILDNILGNNDEPDSEGMLLQRIYDEISNQN